jgi:hypothetical protein
MRKRAKKEVLLLICDSCGKEFKKNGGLYRKALKKGYKHHFCNLSCRGKFRRSSPEYVKSRVLNESVKDDRGCWNWTGKSKRGSLLALDGKDDLAYRVSYILFNGPINDGLFVCHHCDNMRCCNPEHLFLGTHQDNMDDMANKGRRVVGSAVSCSKLTEKDVIEMRKMFKTGGFTRTRLGELFNVSRTTATRIIEGKQWKHVPF